ncbi:MAG TPA: hypothetical protein VLJ68_04025, partial [Chitinophagaceae bacterium]|nr:hypothetical protein [Chitinophagaceae bacterium]
MKTRTLPFLIFGILFFSAAKLQAQCTCISCTGTVIVDQNVTVNFNGAVPVYSGDPDLAPFFSYDISGATPDLWKAIFDLHGNKLLVTNGATISVTNVPANTNNQVSPGIKILSDCEVEVQAGGKIIVSSKNQKAGDIIIETNGHITINGEVRNEVTGTNGLPGALTLYSKCGNINIGGSGVVQVLGVDMGGNLLTLYTCGGSCNNGDITISGLVKSYAHGHGGDQSLNRPNIKVVSIMGAVTVNANTTEPLFDEYSQSGTLYDIWGGLLSWTRDNAIPGKVEVQANGDIVVNGHGTDPTGPVRNSFGAIAAIATA